MSSSAQIIPDHGRAVALDVKQDLEALRELFNSEASREVDLPVLASLRTAAERGVGLADELLAAVVVDADA